MRRLAILSAFLMAGLVSTWICLLLIAQIDLSVLQSSYLSGDTCGDFGQCEVSASVLAKLLFLLFLPSLAHLTVGIVASNDSSLTLWRSTKLLAGLLVGTLSFYLLARLLS